MQNAPQNAEAVPAHSAPIQATAEERLDAARTALRDISEGRGMFGVTAKDDLQWAMSHATKAVKNLS